MTNTNRDVAEYVGDVCNELYELAMKAGLEMLAYVLSMAALEAERQRGKSALTSLEAIPPKSTPRPN